jgi:hypothetical protein
MDPHKPTYSQILATHLAADHHPHPIVAEIARYLTRRTPDLQIAIVRCARLLHAVVTGTVLADGDLFDIVCSPALARELQQVYAYGARKYAYGDYRTRPARSLDYVDAALRHAIGHAVTDTDSESGHLHLTHCLWNLWTAEDLRRLADDRMPAQTTLPARST